MAEQFSDVIRRTPDEDKRRRCVWCGVQQPAHFPVTELYKGEALTMYCCTEEHQRAMQQALE